MANENLSSDLIAALNETVINEAFTIARANRTGILQTAGFLMPRLADSGSKLSWTDGKSDATSSTAAGAELIGATTVTVAAGDGAKFRVGMTVSIVNEVVLVTAVSTDTLTIVRGFGGTTAAAIDSGAKLIIDSVGREENSLAANDITWAPDVVENYFQTMDTAIEYSRRALATAQFGNTNDLAFQVSERIRQLTIQMDRALVGGRKATATIGSDAYTYTGGMRYFLEQAGAINTDASAGALTLEMVNALNEEIITRGGNTNTIAVGVKKARALNALVAANYSSARLQDWSADEGSILRLPSDIPLVGNVNTIVVDTNLRADELVIYDSSMVNVVPMAAGNADDSGAWRTVDATQNGQDGQRVRIIGDFGMEIRQSQTHMARLHNLA